MDNVNRRIDYFHPFDELAQAQLLNLNPNEEQKVLDYRKLFLKAYFNKGDLYQKDREWKKIFSLPHINQLRQTDFVRVKEIVPAHIPGENNVNSAVVEIEESSINIFIETDIQENGVKICTLEKAILEEFVDKQFINKESISIQDDKFALLANGLAKHSVYISIPEGLRLEKPIFVNINAESSNLVLPIRIIVRLGKSSNADVIINSQSRKTSNATTVIPIVMNSLIGKKAQLNLFEVQDFHPQSHCFINQTYFLEYEGTVNAMTIDQGANLLKRNISVFLEGKSSSAKITGLYQPSRTQNYIFDTRQNHHASNTTSDLLFRGVLKDSAYSLWKGNVYVSKGTIGADGFQLNNNLLLDSAAHAESIPGLEIIAGDVKCSHGVTVSDIDEDQLFYLESRGIDRSVGTELIVGGFISGALERVKSPELRKYAMKKLQVNQDF